MQLGVNTILLTYVVEATPEAAFISTSAYCLLLSLKGQTLPI